MCGICGKVNSNKDQKVDPGIIRNMMDAIHYRGPDAEGTYFSNQVGLGHKRLTIIDLVTGKQPISNESGSIWTVYNGEIYNYESLRSGLIGKGHIFKTNTDTEVIVHLYEEYGEGFLTKLRGMFAFALWDDDKKLLMLARDRVGIKPLYYYHTDRTLTFASEVKSILQDPDVSAEVNQPTIGSFLKFYYVPNRETLFKKIYKLSPGHYLLFKDGKVDIRQYWDLEFHDSDNKISLENSTAQLTELMRETVRDHMISDVPVGFLLSGGVDSSALLSFAKDETNKEISTFTVGFEGENFADERPYAKLVAKKYGTKHYDMTITAEDFLSFLPKYVWHMEEPVCEPPAIALYYVSKLAKQHVKVLISGEGGDEAFAGYQNYRNLVWLERIKRSLGSFSGKFKTLVSPMNYFPTFKKYAQLLNVPLNEYYYSRTSGPFNFFNASYGELYTEEFIETLNMQSDTDILHDYFKKMENQNTLNKMLYIDTKTWLPDDLLVKADKITMANSLELRVPFLDHKVLEFAASLPANYKMRGFTTKYILKRSFNKKVPEEILNRKKTGFPVPYESWLRNEFKDVVRSILLDSRTIQRGYFKKNAIQKMIEENDVNKNYSKEIFSLIVLELWHRIFIENESITLT